MSRIKKFLLLVVLALIITLVTGSFMDPLIYPVLVGVRYRGFPFAWQKWVVYPGASLEILWQGFFVDFLAWFLLLSLFYCIYRKL
jgi:hypothetical protein